MNSCTALFLLLSQNISCAGHILKIDSFCEITEKYCHITIVKATLQMNDSNVFYESNCINGIKITMNEELPYYCIALMQYDLDISYIRFIECYDDKNTAIRFSVTISPHFWQ